MSTPAFFQPGGTLAPDSLSYLERAADRELLDALADRQYVFILDARQKGKSSVVGHALSVLQLRGTRVVRVDLQRVGANLDVEKWYAGILNVIGRDLGVASDLFQLWKERLHLGAHARFMEVLELGILDRVEEDVVIFIDEVDFVRSLPFETDEFFAGIRECHNRRAAETKFRRLTFCLVGVASASQLIDNPETTPFNVGDRVELTDFTRWELRPYEAPLSSRGRNGRALLDRVYRWVNGHPYLTQLICRWIADDETIRTRGHVDRLVHTQLLSAEARQREPNLADVERRLLKPNIPGVEPTEARARVIDAYRGVIGKGLASSDIGDEVATVLKLSGAAVEKNGRLVSRNRLYRTLFGHAFIEGAIPRGEAERIRIAARRAAVRSATLVGIAAVGVTLIAILFAILARDRNLALAESRRVAAAAASEGYRASMLLASREALDGSWARVIELVESQRDYPQRGWEWHYFDRVVGRGEVLLPPVPTDGEVNTVWVEDGSIYRACIRDYFRDRRGPYPTEVSVLSTPTAQRFLAAGAGRTPLAKRIAQAEAMNRPGWFLLGASSDGRVLIYRSVEDPLLTRIITPGSDQTVRRPRPQGTLRFSEDGSRAVITSNFGGVEVATLAPYRQIWSQPTDVSVVAFTPDRGKVFTADQGRHLRVFDARDGKLLAMRPIFGNPSAYGEISPDLIALGMYDGTIAVYDTESWTLRTTLIGHASRVTSFTIDRGRLISVDTTGEVRVWPTEGFDEQQSVALGTAEMQYVAASPGGTRVAASSREGQIHLLESGSLRVVQSFAAGKPQNRHDLAFSPDGKRFVFVTAEGTVKLVDPENGAILKVWSRTRFQTARISPSGEGLLAATKEGRLVRLGDDGSEVEILFSFPVQQIAFSPDGRHVALRGQRREIALADARSLQVARIVHDEANRRTMPNPAVFDIEWSADSRLIASPQFDYTVRVTGLDPIDDRLLRGFSGRMWEARFSPDSRLVAANGFDGKVLLWDLRTGEVIAVLKHPSWVPGLAFLPDGSRIATTCEDGTVRLWNLAGQELARLFDGKQAVFDAAFSPGGRRLFTVGTDGVLRAFDASPLPSGSD